MSSVRIRTALASALKPLGFSAHGSQLVLRLAELQHEVIVWADRRLKGRIDVVHSIYDAAEPPNSAPERAPLLEEKLQGFRKPYSSSWSVANFDAALAAKQSAAIVSAFSSLADVAHFYSDRSSSVDFISSSMRQHGEIPPPHRSLSKAESEASLHRLALAIFFQGFQPAPRLGPGIWARNLDVGGFRHCALLAANHTATLASVDYFALASNDVARGSKSVEVASRLVRAPRQTLFDGEIPILLPLTGEALCDHVASTLLRQLDTHPPDALPRDGA